MTTPSPSAPVDGAQKPTTTALPATGAPPRVKPLAPLPRTVEAMKELAQLGSDNPRMPEAYFIEFLHALYDPKLNQFDTSLWYRTFNTWRKSIDILDAAGNLLFVCPPVIGTIRTHLGTQPGQPTLSQISDQAALEGRRHPMLEKKRMKEGLASYKLDAQSRHQEIWRGILERYGLIQAKDTPKPGLTAESLLSDDGDAL